MTENERRGHAADTTFLRDVGLAALALVALLLFALFGGEA